MRNEIKGQNREYYIYFNNCKLIDLAGKVSGVNRNKLVNMALEDFFPLFLDQCRNQETKIGKDIDIYLRRMERARLRQHKYETKSKMAFMKNFINELKDANKIGVSPETITQLIKDNLAIATTYDNYESLYYEIKRFIEINQKEHLELFSILFKDINTDKLAYRKIEEIKTDERPYFDED